MDFSNEILGTIVTASQVSTDGYEVTNLVSKHRGSRCKGFMVERFIKPPVDITFIFSCNVELHLIVLCTAVGCQRSIGIDVVSLLSTGKKLVPKSESSNDDGCSYKESVLAKCYLQDGEDRICFVNRRFRLQSRFNELSEAVVPAGMPSREMSNLPAGVRGLKLRLWRSSNGSLLAMKSVEIHAVPSRDTPDHIVGRLVSLVRAPAARTPISESAATRDKSKAASKQRSTLASPPKTNVEMVPPEFVDPLTCELMTFPIILPSGNTVDQSSLDRHIQSEARWGRLPSDPFTGLPLLNSDVKRRVLPNAQLKSRIDRYLILNSGSLVCATDGRATGTKRSISDEGVASNTSASKVSCIVDKKCSNSYNAPLSISSEKSELAKGKYGSPISLHVGLPIPKIANNDEIQVISETGDHQLRLDRSLDSALKSALGSLTKFSSGASVSSRPNRWDNLFAPLPGCGTCRATDSNLSLYRLPCSHLICRLCLAAIFDGETTKIQSCTTCKVHFSKNDISRVHTGS